MFVLGQPHLDRSEVAFPKDCELINICVMSAQVYELLLPKASTTKSEDTVCYTEMAQCQRLHKGYGHGIRAEGPHRLLV